MTQVGGDSDANLQRLIANVSTKIDVDPIFQNSDWSNWHRLFSRLVAGVCLPRHQRHYHQQHDGEADVVVEMYGWFAHFLFPGPSWPLSELVL